MSDLHDRIVRRKQAAATYQTMRALADAWGAKNPKWKERLNKALAFTGDIEPQGNGVYNVPSEKQTYVVKVTGNTSTCTCEDFRRGNKCKHVLACALLVTAEKRDANLPALLGGVN